MGKKLELISEKSERIVVFLARKVPGLSNAKAHILVRNGEVRVNGKREKTNAVIEAGDTVNVFIPDELQVELPALKIIYDDENIVVFDKPKRTAYDALPQLYDAPLYSVHRIDTNTTGIIVFAKSEYVLSELAEAFKQRRVQKTYRAVVYPAPECDGETLTAYTKLLTDKNIALVSDKPLPGYKTMITEYRVKERIAGAAVLEVNPHTGRTHQIRAHLGFIGCPIIGEHKYGIKDVIEPVGAPDSQMLAATKLTFFGLKGKLAYLNDKTFETSDGFDLSFLRNNSDKE